MDEKLIIQQQNIFLATTMDKLLNNAEFRPMSQTVKDALEDELKQLAQTFAEIEQFVKDKDSLPEQHGYKIGNIIGKGQMAAYVVDSVLHRLDKERKTNKSS